MPLPSNAYENLFTYSPENGNGKVRTWIYPLGREWTDKEYGIADYTKLSHIYPGYYSVWKGGYDYWGGLHCKFDTLEEAMEYIIQQTSLPEPFEGELSFEI